MGSFISTASDFQRGRYWKGLCIKLKGHWFWMRSYITSPSLNIPVQIGRFAECNLFWLTLLPPSNIVVTKNAKIWWKLYWFLKALPRIKVQIRYVPLDRMTIWLSRKLAKRENQLRNPLSAAKTNSDFFLIFSFSYTHLYNF